MGKASKKMMKQQLRNKEQAMKEQVAILKHQLEEQMQAEKYDEAIGTLAELSSKEGVLSAEAGLMYDAAYCYFMTGDYQRTATWINNTLTYEPAHKAARILLARLCILEDRTEDGLAIFDFVLDKWQDSLTEDEKDELEEILEYYGRSETEKIRQHYPHIAAFLGLEPAAGQAEVSAEPASVAETISGVKERAQAAAGDVQSAAADFVQGLREQIPVAQAKLESVKGQVEQVACEAKQKTQDTATGIQATLSAMKQKLAAINAVAKEPLAEKNLTKSAEERTAVVQRDEVLAKEISVAEKIRILNAFAGAHYYGGDCSSAEVLLQAALQLDAYQEATLRNMVWLKQSQGDRDAALNYLAKLPMADFALLHALQQE